MKKYYFLFLSLFLSLSTALFPAAGMAQESGARVSGTVLDGSGAAVPNAQITLLNERTKVQIYAGTSSGDGTFTAVQVPPGTYALTVNAPGFKTTTLSHVELGIAQELNVPVKLALGAVSETVTVDATTRPQLEQGTSTISTLITPEQVLGLPIPNRDVTNLIQLAPGVVHGGASDNISSSLSQVVINGARTLNLEVLLDGSTVVNGATGNVNRLPAADFISEFRIITSTAPAEYGRTSGAVITMGTRSGTNDFHGGIYELFRNDALNANSYFNNLNHAPKGIVRYNEFGFIIGGPVVIPHVYDGRSKTFFFLNYDQILNHFAATSTTTVPTATNKAGDFSTSTEIINYPGTNTQASCNGVLNTICPSQFDPAAAKVLAALPTPNTAGQVDTVNGRTVNNYFLQQALVNVQPRYSGRIDEAIGTKDRMFVAVTRQIMPGNGIVIYGPLLNPNNECDCDQGWEGAGQETHLFSPTLILNLGAGVSRDNDTRVPTSLNSNPTQTFGIGTAPAMITPQLNISSYSSYGTTAGAYSFTIANGFSYFGSVTKILGPHTIKAGSLLRKNQLNVFNPGVQPGGAYNFNGGVTDPGGIGNATTALADFLLGAVKTSSYGLAQPPDGRRNYNIGVYAQDDYKLNSKLLLNLGVRWEYESPMTISNNQYSRIDSGTGILLVANQNATNTLNITTPKADFAPRVGFVWSPYDKTVVRGGYGSYYGLIFSNLGGQVGYPGYEGNQSFQDQGTRKAQPFTLSQGMPLIGQQNLTNPTAVITAATPSNPYSTSSVSFAKVNPLSLNQEWNLGLQQEFFAHTVVEIDYVGSHGVHLPLVLGLNLPNPAQATQVALANTGLATQLARPFPSLGTINGVWNVAGSSYQSLQVQGRRQFGKTLSFLANYTWAHSIDDGSGIYNYSQPNGINSGQYPTDPVFRHTRDRSDAAYDVRHNLTAYLTYTTKGPWYIRDIKIAPIFTAHSGLPITVTQTTEFPGASSQRPNGSTAHLKVPFTKTGTVVRALLDPTSTATSFPLTPSGPVFVNLPNNGGRVQIVPTALGTLGRYSLLAPGEINLDLSASREFPVFERARFELRVDAFNIMNHTNFAAPNTSLTVGTTGPASNPVAAFTNSSFGTITSTISQPRFLQLVGRINF
jgi:hypothetical protein